MCTVKSCQFSLKFKCFNHEISNRGICDPASCSHLHVMEDGRCEVLLFIQHLIFVGYFHVSLRWELQVNILWKLHRFSLTYYSIFLNRWNSQCVPSPSSHSLGWHIINILSIALEPNSQPFVLKIHRRLTKAPQGIMSHPKYPMVLGRSFRVEVKFKTDLISRSPYWQCGNSVVFWHFSSIPLQ